jgi:hypothetical protein
MKNIAIGTVIGVVVLLILVVAALTLLNNGEAAPTPTPTPTPVPSPTPTPTPTPTVTPTPIPDEWAYSDEGQLRLSARLNGNTGQLSVGITIAPGGAKVNVSNLKISIECEGQTYQDVWSLKPMDWSPPNTDNTTLSSDYNIAPRIDTKKLGIPQGKPLTIKVTRNTDPYGQVSVAPTYPTY